MGLLKMDFLGLRNLSVIERALDLIERSTGARPDIDGVDLADERTLAMLRRAESVGVFQLEGSAMRQTLRSLAPTSFDDVAALVALYRPGPMAANMHRDYPELKNGRKELTYLHPDLEGILGDTYGLMLYQESVMRVAQKFAGYTLEEADNLRKACGKKIRALIAAEREKFVAGCVTQGYGDKLGTDLFDIIEPFADYAFNKSHSYGYGLVAYQTAWLKAWYPVEYMAALLTSVKDNKDKTAVYLAECRAMGIEVLVPDVNRSASEFAPRPARTPVATGAAGGEEATDAADGEEETDAAAPPAPDTPGIVFGLAAIRNVGESLVERIVAEREANGPFADIYDFCRRVDPMVLNKRTMESLVKGGAFDSMDHPRQGLCLVLDEIVDRTLARRRERDVGIATLFSTIDSGEGEDGSGDWEGTRIRIPDADFTKAQRLAFEKEMLGLYVSDHPLMGLQSALARHTDATVADLRESAQGGFDGGYGAEGSVRSVGGVVTDLRRTTTKRGDLMARFVLEDLQSSMEVFVFPRVMAEHGALLENDAIVVVRGRLDLRDDEPKIMCMEVRRPVLESGGAVQLRLTLPLVSLTDDTVGRLKEILLEHPGESPVLLELGAKLLRLPPEFNVDSRNGLVGEIKRLLGANAVVA
jgi:DNA polymerase-3 subunit alpha